MRRKVNRAQSTQSKVSVAEEEEEWKLLRKTLRSQWETVSRLIPDMNLRVWKALDARQRSAICSKVEKMFAREENLAPESPAEGEVSEEMIVTPFEAKRSLSKESVSSTCLCIKEDDESTTPFPTPASNHGELKRLECEEV